jgi:hypothetical protein
MVKQQGNSGRGPTELDQAQRNQGMGVDAEESPNRGPLASGEHSRSRDDGALLAEGEKVGPWSDEDEAEDELLMAGDDAGDGARGDGTESSPRADAAVLDRLYADTLVDEDAGKYGEIYGDEHGAPPRRR